MDVFGLWEGIASRRVLPAFAIITSFPFNDLFFCSREACGRYFIVACGAAGSRRLPQVCPFNKVKKGSAACKAAFLEANFSQQQPDEECENCDELRSLFWLRSTTMSSHMTDVTIWHFSLAELLATFIRIRTNVALKWYFALLLAMLFKSINGPDCK